MKDIIQKIIQVGIKTEPPPSADLEAVSDRLKAEVLRELEIHATGNPYYNLEGLGINFVASPRHADLLLVTGPVSKHMEEALRRTWNATPDPKLVVAIGDCGCTGGIFGESYASSGRVSNVIPVDVSVPGCPPPPAAIMQGILTAISADHGKIRHR